MLLYNQKETNNTTQKKKEKEVQIMKNNIIKLNDYRVEFEIIVNELLAENPDWTRFDYKQAWWSNLINEQFKLLKSYNTIVALVDTENHKFYELGKWSTTTSKQVTQYYNKFYSNFDRYLVVS